MDAWRSWPARLALLALLILQPAWAQAGPTCRACASSGAVDCGKHKKAELEDERDVAFCSVLAACKSCQGALRSDCRQCRNAASDDELARRVELIAGWRAAQRARIDSHQKGEALLHLQTAHLDLSFGLERVSVGKDKLDAHRGMHLYARRIEEVRAQFVALLGAKDEAFTGRLVVCMCRDGKQCAELAPHVTGMGGSFGSGCKLMGSEAAFCMWPEPRGLPDDAAVHRNVVHNVVHLLTSNLAPAGWFGNPRHGWVDEGLAHWFEDKIGGKCTNWCFTETLVQPGQVYKGGRWRQAVRALADAGKLTSLAAFADKSTDDLTMEERAQSFARIDFLIAAHGGAKLRQLLVMLKEKAETRDALAAVYGISPLQFDAAFDTWVKDNYSPQESPR